MLWLYFSFVCAEFSVKYNVCHCAVPNKSCEWALVWLSKKAIVEVCQPLLRRLWIKCEPWIRRLSQWVMGLFCLRQSVLTERELHPSLFLSTLAFLCICPRYACSLIFVRIGETCQWSVTLAIKAPPWGRVAWNLGSLGSRNLLFMWFWRTRVEICNTSCCNQNLHESVI